MIDFRKMERMPYEMSGLTMRLVRDEFRQVRVDATVEIRPPLRRADRQRHVLDMRDLCRRLVHAGECCTQVALHCGRVRHERRGNSKKRCFVLENFMLIRPRSFISDGSDIVARSFSF